MMKCSCRPHSLLESIATPLRLASKPIKAKLICLEQQLSPVVMQQGVCTVILYCAAHHICCKSMRSAYSTSPWTVYDVLRAVSQAVTYRMQP
jgi:hypothetical protein